MQASSPTLRLTIVGLIAALSLVAAGPASAREDATIKRIKRTLVALQQVLDEAQQTRTPLGPSTWTLGRRVEQLQREVRVARATGSQVPFTTVVSLFDSQTRHAAALRQMAELDALIGELKEKRSEVITDLQTEVVARTSSRHMDRAAASWSGEGKLITYSADWEATSMCESTGRWHIDSRYDGGLQFDPPTWIGFGGAEFARYAHQASKHEQITVAERVLAIQGPKAWPVCFTPLSTL